MCGTLSVIGNEMSQFDDTQIDWKETPEGHVFKVDVPGLKKEEVEEGNILQISGERSSEKDEKNYTWHRMEGSSTKFLCRFRLPKNAKMDQINVSMENEVFAVDVT
ncbi:hypothetical protein ACS0TY_003410 [Phlomoides rotata]